MKFKEGDKVKVLDGSECYDSSSPIFVPAMKEFVGKVFTVKERITDNVYLLDTPLPFWWDYRWLELVERKNEKTVTKTEILNAISDELSMVKDNAVLTLAFATFGAGVLRRLFGDEKKTEA